MSLFETYRTELEALTHRVQTFERALDAGENATLGDLERKAQTLCQKITQGDTATAKALQPYMADLISALDSLAERLQALTERLKHRSE